MTVGGVAGLLVCSPFDSARQMLDRVFAAGPSWAQVRSIYTDPATQEVSHGENPSRSLEILRASWSDDSKNRIVFIGNSQMFYMSLAPGEPAPTSAEKTYPDLVADRYSDSAKCYRLAAPGMSYTEALWYATVLLHKPRLRPTAIVLQLNYQSFWNGGIRDGMLDTLSDPDFKRAIEELAASGQPYSDDFADALHRYTRRVERAKAARKTDQASAALAGPALANRLESSVRSELESTPLWKERTRHRGDFFDLLYSARIYLLHVNPTTARSITGTRLERSQASLKAIAQMCNQAGVRLLAFNAPVNPHVSLYQTAADVERYRGILDELKNDYHVAESDLEHSIPASLWGTWMNGPDPLHLGREAHRRMAALMTQFINSGLQGKLGG